MPVASYGTDWILFTLDDSGEYINVGVDGTLKTGKGYWIIQYTGAGVELDVTPAQSASAVQSAACSSTNGCYEVPVASNGGTHWNLIGVPLDSELEINAATARLQTISGLCMNGCSLNAAKDANYAHNQMWRYTDAGYELI